jgi:hypothetical protein
VLADAFVRGFALPFGAEIAAAVIIGGGYAIAIWVLLSRRLAFDPTLAARRSLVLLAASPSSAPRRWPQAALPCW